MGKSKSTTKTNQTQTNAPPAFTSPALTQAGAMTQNALNQLPTQHYSGPMVATMDPAQLAAITGAWAGTAGNAADLSGWMQGMLPQLQNGMSFTTALPDTSYSLAPRQELDSVIAASIDPVQRQLMEQILPSITNSALAAGAYSGDRAMGVLPTDAVRNATESMQRIAAQLGYEDYQNYENRRLAAYQATTGASQQNYALETARQQAEQADMISRMSLIPDYVNNILHTQASSGDLLRMAADLETTQRQAAINNMLGMDQYASQAPFMGLDTASEILARLSGNYGTQNMKGTTTTTQSQPLGMQLLQGALGIGSMIAGFPGAGAALGLGSSLAAPAAAGASSLFAPALTPFTQPLQPQTTLANLFG